MLTEKRPTVCSANMEAQMSWARRRPPRELPCPPTLQAQHQSPALQTYYIVTFLRSQSSTGDQVLGVFLHEHGTHNRALLNVPTSCAHKMLRASHLCSTARVSFIPSIKVQGKQDLRSYPRKKPRLTKKEET